MTEKKEISMNGIEKRFAEYSFAVLYELSDILLAEASSVTRLPSECYEARFFSENGELHIFETETSRKAVEIRDDGTDCIDACYELDGRFRSLGRKLTIRKNLAVDEDGQSYIANTRLIGIE